jgi:hypothetical protein
MEDDRMATATRPILATAARRRTPYAGAAPTHAGPAIRAIPVPRDPRAPRAPRRAEQLFAAVGGALCIAILLASLLVLAWFMVDLAAGALTEATARLVTVGEP